MIVALAGRPNVGKSSLFNRLVGFRKALVWNQPGVTRDLLRGIWKTADLGDIEIWDLAGFGKTGISIENLDPRLKKKISAILLVVDGSEPLTAEDRDVFQIVRKLNLPIIAVINKSDKKEFKTYSSEIFSNFDAETVEISAEQIDGFSDLEDTLKKVLTPIQKENPSEMEEAVKVRSTKTVAILGRPNVGKSSFINKVTGEPVSFVSDIAGTTRDPLEASVIKEKTLWALKDLAGVRKKSKVYGRKADPLEIFSMKFALNEMKESDYALFIVEATLDAKLHSQDRKLLHLIRASLVPTLILVNKWDLVRKDWSEDDYKDRLKDELKDLSFLPVLFVSAKTGYRIDKAFQSLREMDERMKMISTSKLNKWLRETLMKKAPRVAKHGQKADRLTNQKRTQTQFLNFSYMVQTSARPMSFQIFCNAPHAVAEDDKRFFENRLRREFHLTGIPLKLIFRKKTSDSGRRARIPANPLAERRR